MKWISLRYHNRPSVIATIFDIAIGFTTSLFLAIRYRIDIVHARSYVPSVIALMVKAVTGARFIFDMRGFWADERADGGVWGHQSLIYRIVKWLERRFLLGADVVVSLTHAAVAAMRQFPFLKGSEFRCEVITTCTDLDAFRPIGRSTNESSIQRPFRLCYLGSVSSRYLFEQVLESFIVLRGIQQDAVLVVINRGSHAHIKQQLRLVGIPESAVEIKSMEYENVALELSDVDAGIFFYKPAFCALATAPTKLGEFLACGVPCLGNAGVGDVQEILESERVGVIQNDFTHDSRLKAMQELIALTTDPDTKARCLGTARRQFSIDRGVESYDRIYRSLTLYGA
jgi:glycosyltransferase involved in cell wall biosynthesis